MLLQLYVLTQGLQLNAANIETSLVFIDCQ